MTQPTSADPHAAAAAEAAEIKADIISGLDEAKCTLIDALKKLGIVRLEADVTLDGPKAKVGRVTAYTDGNDVRDLAETDPIDFGWGEDHQSYDNLLAIARDYLSAVLVHQPEPFLISGLLVLWCGSRHLEFPIDVTAAGLAAKLEPLAHDKAIIVAALKTLGVAVARAEYDGEGDEGQINDTLLRGLGAGDPARDVDGARNDPQPRGRSPAEDQPGRGGAAMSANRAQHMPFLSPRGILSAGAGTTSAASASFRQEHTSGVLGMMAVFDRTNGSKTSGRQCGFAVLLGTLFLVHAPAAIAQGPKIGGCPVFPTDNIWNTPVDRLPVDPRSRDYVASIGADVHLHPDFGAGLYEGAPLGIPYAVVPMNQPKVAIHFRKFGEEEPAGEESDAGPYPIPRNAPIEGGPNSKDDRHVLVVQQGSCTLFELYKAVPNRDGSWNAVSAARFDLESHELRIDGHTSADAAGLPILPGLVRYEEVAAGEIRHALRFTTPRTRKAYLWPARHYASDSTDDALPPLGQRFRLRGDFDVSGFSPANQVILRALQTYGMFLADNGSPWFLSGAPHPSWNNDQLRELRRVKGSDFEAVDISSLMRDPNSGKAGN